MIKSVIVNISRLLLSLTFIFSGFVKAVDPLGTQYKLEDYAAAMSLDGIFPTWILLCGSVAMSALEVMIGIQLLFAINRRIISKVALLYMLVMTGLTAAFTAYIGITGIVTGSADAAAVKTAKTVISGVLPVVGGILSDAASAVLLAAGIIKNSAGAFALIVVCAMCVGPFGLLAVRMLLLRLAAAVTELTEGDRLSAMLNDLASGMALLLGLVGSYGIMLFFSFYSAMRVATL